MSLTQPAPFVLYVWDWAPLSDAEACHPGYYFAAAPYGPDEDWRGGVIYESRDGGSTFQPIQPVSRLATYGRAKTVLADPAGGGHGWDRASTVQVEITRGELESRPELDVLNGANAAILGSEVLAFQNATLVSERVYDLDTFIRGQRNTEDGMGDHEIGEDVLLLTRGSIGFRRLDAAQIGAAIKLKLVPDGGAPADFPALDFTPNGGTILPLPPANLVGVRQANDDIVYTWDHRSRGRFRFFDGVEHRLCCCDDQKYRVTLKDGSGTTTLRTVDVEDATTHTYTLAQQQADGLTGSEPVRASVQQISTVLGPGRATAEITTS